MGNHSKQRKTNWMCTNKSAKRQVNVWIKYVHNDHYICSSKPVWEYNKLNEIVKFL